MLVLPASGVGAGVEGMDAVLVPGDRPVRILVRRTLHWGSKNQDHTVCPLNYDQCSYLYNVESGLVGRGGGEQ
jgi:hypothetical protein